MVTHHLLLFQKPDENIFSFKLMFGKHVYQITIDTDLKW